MKLILKKGKAKNFLSIGSKPIEIDYTPGIHGVIGKIVGQESTNGVGKSTIFQDLIVFAFYGKSIRGTNKKEIIDEFEYNRSQF
jgi:uncharacterized protein YydD (DUF2326 family)